MAEIEFLEEKLFAAVVHESKAPDLCKQNTFVIIDPATTDSKRADSSCLGFFQVAPDEKENEARAVATPAIAPDKTQYLWVRQLVFEKCEQLELPFQIARNLHLWQPGLTIIEKLGFWALLEAEIVHEAKQLQDAHNLLFFRASNRKAAKAERIREFQKLFDLGRVRFVATGDYLDTLFDQFVAFDPLKRSRHDDGPDVCSMAAFHYECRLIDS